MYSPVDCHSDSHSDSHSVQRHISQLKISFPLSQVNWNPIDTADACEILHLLVDSLSHYPMIYDVSWLPILTLPGAGFLPSTVCTSHPHIIYPPTSSYIIIDHHRSSSIIIDLYNFLKNSGDLPIMNCGDLPWIPHEQVRYLMGKPPRKIPCKDPMQSPFAMKSMENGRSSPIEFVDWSVKNGDFP